MADTRIRPAEPRDLARLTEIYNHYVANTAITFDIETRTPEERWGWYEDHTIGPGHRLLVAEEGTNVVGYAGCGTFRAKRAYETTVETTIYCAPGQGHKGIGTALYALIETDLGRPLIPSRIRSKAGRAFWASRR